MRIKIETSIPTDNGTVTISTEVECEDHSSNIKLVHEEFRKITDTIIKPQQED